MNDWILTINGLLLMAGIGLLVLIAFTYYRFTLKKIKTQKKLIIAEIKRRQLVNVRSPQFSNTYNKDLNALLKMWEDKRGYRS